MRRVATSQTLVSLTEIAALTQVKRPVPTTWRRRYPDFPPQVGGTAARPLFGLGAVVDWIVARGLGNAESGRLRAEPALHTLATRTARRDPRQLLAVTTALLCLRFLNDDEPLLPDPGTVGPGSDPAAAWSRIADLAERTDPDDQFLASEITTADGDAADLAALADDCAEAAFGARGAFDALLDARTRLGLADLTVDALSPSLTALFTRLTGVAALDGRQKSVIVADPAAGAGDLLAAVANTVERDASPMVFLAAERDPYLARLTRRRLLVHGVADFDFDVTVGDELTEDMGAPNVIVARLPYQAAEERDPAKQFARIERIADLLGPGCIAVVHGPADVLAGKLPRYSPAERARSRLLASGIVESVVRLPGGLLPFRPGYHTALWTLIRGPIETARGRVLILDVSTRDLTDQVCAQLADDVAIWRAEGYQPAGHDARYGGPRDIRTLVAPPLLGEPLEAPRVRGIVDRAVVAPERVAQIHGAEDRLEQLVRRDRARPMPGRSPVARRLGPLPQRTTLRALINAKRVQLLPGARIDEADIGTHGNHPVLGPNEALGRARPGARRIDRETLVRTYGRAQFTQPGDLVLTTTPDFGVIVDEEGFSVVTFPARVLRIRARTGTPDFTPRVLAALLSALGTARSAGAVRAARRLEEYEIPDLSHADIQRFDELLSAVEIRRTLLAGQLDALDEARRLTAAGLADGTLMVADPTNTMSSTTPTTR